MSLAFSQPFSNCVFEAAFKIRLGFYVEYGLLGPKSASTLYKQPQTKGTYIGKKTFNTQLCLRLEIMVPSLDYLCNYSY